MKSFIKENKAITLMTLVITIIVLGILASVAVYSGVEVLNSSRLTRFTSEMKIIQTKVNEAYENIDDYEDTGDDPTDYTTEFNSIVTALGDDFTTWGYSNDIEDYKYYSNTDLKDDFNIEDVEQSVLIDISRRKVISVNGVKVDGQMYYVLEQLPNSMYNVEYNSLPDSFQTVEYIESTGMQYINTGYIPKIDTELKLDISFRGGFIPSSRGGTIFSSKNSDGKYTYTINFGGAVNQANNLYVWNDKTYGQGGVVKQLSIDNTTKNNRNIINLKPDSIIYSSYNLTLNKKSVDSDNPLILLGNSDNVDIVPFDSYTARVYELKLYERGKIVRHYIPCYCTKNIRNVEGEICEEGTIGLYDLVQGKFYTNQGTETFKKGPNKNDFDISSMYIGDGKFRINVSNVINNERIEKWTVKYKKEGQEHWNTSKDLSFVVNEEGKYYVKIVNGNIESNEMFIDTSSELPLGFKKVEYLESTGTQWIDTGFTNNSPEAGYYIKCQHYTGNSGEHIIMGILNPNRCVSINGLKFYTIYKETGYGGDDSEKISITASDITEAWLNFNNSSKRQININENMVYQDDLSPITTTNSKSWYVFASNNGTPYGTGTGERVYNVKISVGNQIVMDFIPCLDNNGIPCMYDLVGKKAYYNAGTGQFYYGY